jgi:hypothetical protein
MGTAVGPARRAASVEHGSINPGQSFPDTGGPEDVIQAAAGHRDLPATDHSNGGKRAHEIGLPGDAYLA